jgi:hypothetical protein
MMPEESKEVDVFLTEYKSLREEIITKMDFCWKILTFETGGTSIVLGFVFAEGAYDLLPLVPFLILASSFIYLSETSAIINAGNYIRDSIQTNLKKILGNDKLMSWESFVENQSTPYKLVHISTACLFMGMFWASIVLIFLFKYKMQTLVTFDWALNLLLIGYTIGFFVYLYAWYTQIVKKI